MLKNYLTFYTCNQHISIKKSLPAYCLLLQPLPFAASYVAAAADWNENLWPRYICVCVSVLHSKSCGIFWKSLCNEFCVMKTGKRNKREREGRWDMKQMILHQTGADLRFNGNEKRFSYAFIRVLWILSLFYCDFFFFWETPEGIARIHLIRHDDAVHLTTY